MGVTDYGTQTHVFDYRQAATGKGFNRLNYKLLPPGIYEGGTLTRISDTIVEIDPLVCYITDSGNDVGVRIETAVAQQITISSAEPWVVLRFNWVNAENNYMDMIAVNHASIQADDLVVGKAVYDVGLNMQTTFDYTERDYGALGQRIEDMKNALRVYVTDPVSNKLEVIGGEILSYDGTITVADGQTPSLSDTTNGRIDLIYIDNDGSIAAHEGVDSSSPEVPDYESRMVIAEVHRGASATYISGDNVVQVRDFDRLNIDSRMRTENAEGYFLENNIERSLDQLAEEIDYSIVSQKSLLVYYAYMSSINSSFSSELEMAVSWFLLYDVIAISYIGPLAFDDPGIYDSDEWDRVKEIITAYHEAKPQGKFFGYIPIGYASLDWIDWYLDGQVGPEPEYPGSVSEKITWEHRPVWHDDPRITWRNGHHYSNQGEIPDRVARWAERGADGIFWDEAGWDYGVPRERQIACKTLADQYGLASMWNSWRPDEVLDNYITQRQYHAGTGLLTMEMYSGYCPLATHGDSGKFSLRVFCAGIEYTRYTGGGTPGPGEYKELSDYSVQINKNHTTDLYVEVRNYSGFVYDIEGAGNLDDDDLTIDTYDWWLYESFANHGIFSPTWYDYPVSGPYGWEYNGWLMWKSDRARVGQNNKGAKVAAVTRCAYTDMFVNNDPSLLAAENFDYRWQDVQPENSIENYLMAAYAFSLMYGFDAWGHADPNYHASSGKTYPFNPPRIPIDLINKKGEVAHLHGPESWGIYRFESIHQRGYSGGLIQCVYDGRPLNSFLPITFKVYGALQPVFTSVGLEIGQDVKFLGGAKYDKYLRSDGGTASEDTAFDKDIRVQGNVLALPIMEDPQNYDLLPEDGEGLELSTPDLYTARGRAPIGKSDVVYEAAVLGPDVYHPLIKPWLGRTNEFFPYLENEFSDPIHVTSALWTPNSTETMEMVDEYVRGFQLSQVTIPVGAGGGNIYYTAGYTGGVTSEPISTQMILKRGNVDQCYIQIRDWSAAGAYRLHGRINFVTQTIDIDPTNNNGRVYDYEWIDDETVWVSFITDNITNGNAHSFYIGALQNNAYFYVTAVQLEEEDNPTPFMQDVTPAGLYKRDRGSFTAPFAMPATGFSIDMQIQPWFRLDSGRTHTFFEWRESATQYLEIVCPPIDTSEKVLVLWWSGYVNFEPSDIGKTVTDGGAKSGTLLRYNNTSRWIIIDTSDTWVDGDFVTVTAGTGQGEMIQDEIVDYREFRVRWRDGGTERFMYSRPIDDGTYFDDIHDVHELTLAFDPTDVANGCEWYVDNSLETDAWSGAVNNKSTTFSDLRVGDQGGTTQMANSLINHVRIYNSLVDYDDINLGFPDEVVLWDMSMEAYPINFAEVIRRGLVGFWEETDNLIEDSNNLTTGNWPVLWGAPTRSQENIYVMNEPLTYLESSAVGGSAAIKQDLSFTGTGTKTIEFIARRGNSNCTITIGLLYTNATSRFHVEIYWASKTYSYVTGTEVSTIWLDDETVWIRGLSTSSAEITTPYLQFSWGASPVTTPYSCLISRVQVMENNFPVPYTYDERPAAEYAFVYDGIDAETQTIEMFLHPYFDYQDSNRILFWVGSINSQYDIIIAYWNQRLRCHIRGATNQPYVEAGFNGTSWSAVNQFGSNANLHRWIHLKFTYDTSSGTISAANMKMFIDGLEIVQTPNGAGTLGAFSPGQYVSIGNAYLDSTVRQAWNGYITDVAMYPRWSVDGIHYLKKRPYYAKTRLMGKNSSWKIDKEGAAFFKHLTVYGDLIVHGEIISDKAINPAYAE